MVGRRRLRVVHLVSSLNVGGLEMLVWNMARHADRSQFELRVMCLEEPGELAGRFAGVGVPVEAVPCGKTAGGAAAVFRLARRLDRLRPDVLHTHNPFPHLYGTIAARLARLPVLVNTKHGRNRTDLPRQILMNRVLSYFSSCVVAVSQDAAAVARRIERVPRSRLKVIRNGVDVESFRPPVRPHPFGKRAIHVARLNLIKDQPTLLRAARLVLRADAAFRLDIVGDGPAMGELRAVHAELGLGDSVKLIGQRNDVRALLCAADLFVLSSLSEGISLTLLEAMASGLPVVATDVGGNREVVLDGQTGLLVPPQSAEALATAILSLLRNPDRARSMGAAGRARAEAEFDVRRVVAQYQALYRRLAGRREQP